MGDLVTDLVVNQEEPTQGPKKFLKKFSHFRRMQKNIVSMKQDYLL